MPPRLVAQTTNDVSTAHPDYVRRAGEWQRMRDTVEGEGAVLDAAADYLPVPSGFAALGSEGLEMYAAYAARARFPEIVEPTITGMLGVVHKVEAQIELPPELEHLYEDADGRGTPLEQLHRNITRELLTVGRVALLADAPAEGGEPYIALYRAEDLVNWAEDRSFFVLSEAGLVRDGFRWDHQERWRVLRLEDGRATFQVYDEDKRPVEPETTPLSAQGGAPLDEIPLVVAGARHLEVKPDRPPIIGVASSALDIFRLSADYRHQLFSTGQETLVISGMESRSVPKVVGAGVILALSDPAASATYVSPSGVGIQAHKTAIDDERQNAAALGARVFDMGSKAGVESGDALRIRRSAETANLLTVALSSASALERAIRYVARWHGMSEAEAEKIVVVPNLDFVRELLTPDAALKLVTMWQSAAISYETLYENLQAGGIASMERDSEEERDLIEEEGGGDLGEFSEEEEEGEETQDGENGEVSDDELRETFSDDLLEEAGV